MNAWVIAHVGYGGNVHVAKSESFTNDLVQALGYNNYVTETEAVESCS